MKLYRYWQQVARKSRHRGRHMCKPGTTYVRALPNVSPSPRDLPAKLKAKRMKRLRKAILRGRRQQIARCMNAAGVGMGIG